MNDSNGKLFYSNCEHLSVATLINNYFLSLSNIAIPNTSITINNDNIINVNYVHTLPDFEIATNEVLKALKSLKTNKTQNLIIPIPYYSKKQKAKYTPVSYYIFKSPLLDGTVPSDWKMAKATPIFKKRDKTELDKSRPINKFSLEKRRLPGKLIGYFKNLNGFTNIAESTLFEIDGTLRTRYSGTRLKCRQVNSDYTEFFFTNFLTREWNEFPPSVVQCSTIDLFINKLDRGAIFNLIY